MNIDRFPVPLACCERRLNWAGLPDETVKGFRVTVDVNILDGDVKKTDKLKNLCFFSLACIFIQSKLRNHSRIFMIFYIKKKRVIYIWPRGHKSETVSLMVSVSLFFYIFFYRK